MTTPTLTRVEFNLGEVQDLSQDFMEYLEETQTEVGFGAVALGLTLGKVLCGGMDKVMTDAEQSQFIEAIMEFVSTYFAATGEVN